MKKVPRHRSLDRGYFAKNERWKSDWICQRRVGIGRGGTLWHRSEWKETWQLSSYQTTLSESWPLEPKNHPLKKKTCWRRKSISNYWYHMPILVVKALSAWYELIWYRFDLMFYDSMPWRSGPITLIGILLATTPHIAATTPTTTTNNTRT